MPYKLHFISLGCAKNVVNCEQMMSLCREAGHTLTDAPEGADAAIVNTCGFLSSASEEAIQNILRMAELKAAGKLKKILVTGCMTQRYGEDIPTELPEVDGILGTGSYKDIVSAVADVMAGEHPRYFGDLNAPVDEFGRVLTTPPWYAYLRIAEGCDNHCAYCVIPSLRGKYRSRPMAELLDEAAELSSAGVKELLVIAQDITRYGTDLNGEHQLAALLRELAGLDFHWIRLHYLYPDEITEELIDTIASEPKILPYLDIPIQHCNDGILKAMRRRNTKAELTGLFDRLRAAMPDVVIRTSLICGLPGETEEDFEDLCQFVTETGIERAGVFQYSREEGTLAARMENQVPEEIARQRVERLVELQSRVLDAYNESRLGTVMEVLCEGFDNEMGCYVGRTYADSVEVDGHVYFTAAGLVPAGTFVNVRMTGTEDGDLTGEVEE